MLGKCGRIHCSIIYYCLCRRASAEAANRQAETYVRYSLETSSAAKETNRQAETFVHYSLETSSAAKETNRQAEISVCYPLETSSFTKETSYPSPAMQSEAPTVTKTWMVNHALTEDVPNHIEGGGSQVGSEESDRGTARWIGNQLQQNGP